MNDLPLVLRNHREELWRHWVDALEDEVSVDYRELMNSALGERFIRSLIDDMIAWKGAEKYEAPGQLRKTCAWVARDAANRMSLGFTALEMTAALQALRGAIIDVLIDALVVGELPSFAETLEQVKNLDWFINQLVTAVLQTESSVEN